MTNDQIKTLTDLLSQPGNVYSVEEALTRAGMAGPNLMANMQTAIGEVGRRAADLPNGHLMETLQRLATQSRQCAEAAQPFLNSVATRGGEYGRQAVEIIGRLPTPNATAALEKMANSGYGAAEAAYEQICQMARTAPGALRDTAAQMLQRIGQGTGPYAAQARDYIAQNGIQLTAGGTGTALATTSETAVEVASQTGIVARLASIGRVLGYTGRAATMVGGATVVSGLTLAGIVAYLLAGAIGGMGVNSVEPGSKMSEEHHSQRPPENSITGGGYYVVVPEGSKIISVRSAKAVDEKALAWGDFLHGGLSREPVPGYSLKEGPFKTAEEATKHLAGKVAKGSIRKIPLAEGDAGQINGESYTLDSWSSLDMRLLRGLVNQ